MMMKMIMVVVCHDLTCTYYTNLLAANLDSGCNRMQQVLPIEYVGSHWPVDVASRGIFARERTNDLETNLSRRVAVLEGAD